MAADAPHEPGLDVDLLAASLRADVAESDAFAEALATKLTGALPGGVRVQRRRDGLFGPRRVQEITVDLGGQRLQLHVGGAGVQTTRARVSGGITLKSEPMPVEEWFGALSRALAEQAASSERTRRALERLLLG